MPKRKAPLTDKYAAGKTGVPGGDKLTNAELSAALGPAGAILDKYEQTERNRVESTATAMHERLPEAQDHIARSVSFSVVCTGRYPQVLGRMP